jgi:tetratricopeptide (TPR) repeat protein
VLGVLGVLLFLLAQPEDAAFRAALARGDYASALTFHPGDITVWDHWIATYANQQPAVAGRMLEQAAAISGWTAARRRQYADLLAAQGDSSNAYRLRRALLTDFPNDIALWQQVSAADMARHNWPEAIADLTHLADLTPNDGERLYTLGILLTIDHPDQALHYLGLAVAMPTVHDKALTVSQTLSRLPHGAALSQIGLNLAAAGDWALADYVLARASALNNAEMSILAMYGVAQEQQGYQDNGWLLIQQAAQRAPTDPVVSYALAAHWQRLGNWDAALAVMNDAEVHDPNNPALAEQIGLIYVQRGATDPAAHWLLLAVQLAPTNAEFSQALAELYADQSYLLNSGGLTFIQSAVKLFPTNAGLHTSLGAALFATGQTVAAILELRQAVTLDPSSARAGYYLAEALERAGDLSGASQAYLAAAQPPLSATNDSYESVFRRLAERAVARLGLSG